MAARRTEPVTAQIRLPDQSAVRLSGVTVKTSGKITLNDIDLAIERNTCFGIAGNETSGLGTLAEVIAAVRIPSHGTVQVVGFDSKTQVDDIRSRVGYLPYPHTVPPNLRVEEYLSLQAAALGTPRERWESMVDTLLTLAGIAGRQRAFTDELGASSRQLLGVAGALVHDPGVVVLHEPTEGLDVRESSRLWNMLRRLNDVSRTVIVCSRHLSELSAGCARIAVLNEGAIVDEGPPADVVGRLGGARRIRARLANGAVRTHTVADEAAQATLLRRLVLEGVDLVEFAEVPPELDDLTIGRSTPSVPRGSDDR